MENFYRRDKNFKTLIDLGTAGHFPLFDSDWLAEALKDKNNKITRTERARAKKIFQRLSEHRSIDRKKTLLQMMEETDRVLFIRSFFKLVEGRILDKKSCLQ